MANHTQGPCPCGVSSDAFTVFEDGGYTCFSCNNTKIPASYKANHKKGERVIEKPKGISRDEMLRYRELWKNAKVEALPDRGLSQGIAKKYGVRIQHDDMGKPQNYYFPQVDSNKKLVAFKTKSVAKGSSFYTTKRVAEGPAVLYGQHLFPSGGKFLTITEGEFDAMAAHEMLKSAKVPSPACVSLVGGANSTKIFEDPKVFEYVNSFDTIVLSFDNDRRVKRQQR